MLKFLNVSNFAVVDNLQMDFTPGLNILSGETGSGKSIIIDALGIISGNRISAELIRSGEERAFVEGVFVIADNSPLLALLQQSGIEVDDDEIVIKREIALSGRGRIFINNQSATVALLKNIQPHIIDIHGQGEQQSLLSTENQLKIYDLYIGVAEQRNVVESLYGELSDLLEQYASLQRGSAMQLRELDILEHQVAEIRQADLKLGEDEGLEQEQVRLTNAEKILDYSGDIYRLLYDDEISVLSSISQVQKRLTAIAEIDETLSVHLDNVANAKYLLEDVAFAIRAYMDSIERSSDRLQQVIERIVEISKLKRKYGGSIAKVLETMALAMERIRQFNNKDKFAEELKRKIVSCATQFDLEAAKLTTARKAQKKPFEQLLKKELANVAIEQGTIELNFIDYPLSDFPSSMASLLADSEALIIASGSRGRFGKEFLEFLFSANAGEVARKLTEVASGGELSRLMLVLKTITSPTPFPRTLIFDEIDTGIGGRVADAVGSRLKRLSTTNQVLCVTHQAQVARYADSHFLIAKDVKKGRTYTSAYCLDHEGRVNELARMLAGQEVTSTAKRHARELLRLS